MPPPLETLPPGFPPIEVKVCQASRREPGCMILSLGRGTRAVQQRSDFEALVAIDREGRPVWCRQSASSVMDVKRTPRDTLLVVTTDGCIQEIDAGGAILRKWSTPGASPSLAGNEIPVDTLYFHHAVRELPGGNLAALSISAREFDDYPLSLKDPGAGRGKRKLVADVLVEFTPEGDVVHAHDFFDILDSRRTAYGLDAPFWTVCGVVPGGADLTHANGLVHDPADDSFIITVRHQDCLIKIDRATGALKWILGAPEGWTGDWADKVLEPVGETSWHWHSHDPSIMADGSVLLFDNGESGAIPPAPPIGIDDCVSRAIAYRVDEAAGTVEQVWSFGGPEHGTPYAMYISGAYELPATGNVFVTFGGIILGPGGERVHLPPAGHGSAEVYEVTRADDPEILFHAAIDNRHTGEEVGWGVFRAEWVPEGFFGG